MSENVALLERLPLEIDDIEGRAPNEFCCSGSPVPTFLTCFGCTVTN